MRPDRTPNAYLLIRSWVATLFLLLLTAGAALAEDIGTNKSELIRGLLPTVVNISTTKVEKPSAPPEPSNASAKGPATPAEPSVKNYVGSGFIIDPTGVVVTNYHVVEDAFQIIVTFSDGTRLPGKTLSASRLADLAIVKVEPTRPLEAAHWGDSDKVQVGDQVFAAGNPFGIGLSVSAGIVSGLNRDIQNSPYDDLIQTDATINHGNSGGPLFDMQGNVVGVNSAIISPTQGSSGLGFAIPSRSAHFVIDRLRTYGWVRPAWIGVKLQEVTHDMAHALGMDRPSGSIVAWVRPDGPAAKAGVAVGDVVVKYNEVAPTDERALLRLIAQTDVGNTISLLVQRNRQEMRIPIKVDSWPRNQWDALDAPVETQRPKIAIPPDLGLSLAPVPPDERAKLPPENQATGVLIARVLANSDPANRGVTGGDIVLRVQDKPVATPAEVLAGINAARGAKRSYVMLLILPKVQASPGPKWFALETGAAGG